MASSDSGGGSVSTYEDVYVFMKSEFTTSNHYILQFTLSLLEPSYFVFGHNPNLETQDGLFLGASEVIYYNDNTEIDRVVMQNPLQNYISYPVRIVRDGNKFDVLIDYGDGFERVYNIDQDLWNTIGVYKRDGNPTAFFQCTDISLEPYIIDDITPSTDDYDGSVYGSDLHLELRGDHLNFIDYGMLPSGAIGGAKVLVNEVPINTDQLSLEIEMTYNNSRFERLNNLTGQMQMRIYEDISIADSVQEYSRVLCSPMVVPNVQTVFTRHSEEGILYYVKDPRMNSPISPYYLCNAYNQYKGGCQIQSETQIQLFNLDNSFSPVSVGNNLVKAEFHRRSGYIRISRWDENSNQYIVANVLKLQNNPQLSLIEYNDDYCELTFGATTWKFYRGRPFIVVNHSEDDLRILNLVDRVYCETLANQRSMGFIDEYNPRESNVYTDENGKQVANYSVFTPQLSIQQFQQDLHIGQNIRKDNFELYEIDSNDNVLDVSNNSIMGITQVDNDNALVIEKGTGKVGLNFPSYSHYVKRVGDTFSLLIGYVDSEETNITIKARGFNEKGAVPIQDGIQYGIWEQTKTATINNGEIRVTFTGCPSEVKYIDFVVIFNSSASKEIIFKDFMYYQGDSEIKHDVDTSTLYAEQVDIIFDETYYANLYNADDTVGLCIVRPNQQHISLRKIYASEETVFIPYMKKCKEWDAPSQVFLEYLNSKRQIIDIDWEN